MYRHGFHTIEDPHGRWWRDLRAHYWFSRDESDNRLWCVHVGGQWVHFHKTLRRLGLKVSTTGEETLDVAYGLGPLAQHYWSLDVERHGKLVRLPQVRFDVDLGLTGASWCFGQDDHSWHRNASRWERLRRNDIKWFRVYWYRKDNVIVDTVMSEVALPEGNVPVSVTLERGLWGVMVGPYSSNRNSKKRLRFWVPGFRRVEHTAGVDASAAGGLPHPGKGENSWDCGQDALMQCSARVSAPFDSHDRRWVAEAIAKATQSVLSSRIKYGSGITDQG